MIKSMTGFGRAEANVQGIKMTIEIKSVNHKYHDVMFKMPKDLLMLEEKMKKLIKQYVKRGRVDVFISLDVEDNPFQQLKVDWNLAEQYLKVADELKRKFQIEGEVTIKDVLNAPELFDVGQEIPDVERLAPDLLHTLEAACKNLRLMRENEGEHLYRDLSFRIDALKTSLQAMKARAPLVTKEYREKVKTRVTEWLDGLVEIDEGRLLNEVAFFTDKANVDEELTRLQSHFHQFLTILEHDEPVGRKLDFLIQEMNREVNTIGSKANDLTLSQLVVEMKSELEKAREQVQNVE